MIVCGKRTGMSMTHISLVGHEFNALDLLHGVVSGLHRCQLLFYGDPGFYEMCW